jgi:hypothetical protein
MLVADLCAAGRPGLNVVVDAESADELLTHAKDPSSLVHGLVRSTAEEAQLRSALLAADRTDRVTVSIWDGMDQWGQHFKGAGNNAVPKDTVVGPPRRFHSPTSATIWSISLLSKVKLMHVPAVRVSRRI